MSGQAGEAGDPPGKQPDSLDLLESCGVCRERLRAERDPLLLPCLHSVCRQCLWAAPGPSAAPGPDGEVATCPICKYQCHLKDIMENYFLRDSGAEAAATSQSSSQCCTSCEDNAPATSYCVECSEPLCETCVEAHQRVKYTKDHTVRATGKAQEGQQAVYCSVHTHKPLALFCDTCDALICCDCQHQGHKDHQSQLLEEAVRTQQKTLALLVQRLGDKLTSLQCHTKELRSFMREVTDMQKQVQVDVKMATLQLMKELNKRSEVLLSDAQRLAEGQQERLEQQYQATLRLQRHHQHVLRFLSWALGRDNSAALLLCRKLLCDTPKVTVDPLEPQGDMKFQWDVNAWTKSIESFGTIILEQSLPPPSLSPQPLAPSPRGPSPAVGPSQGPTLCTTVVSKGHCAPLPLLQPPLGPPVQAGEGQGPPLGVPQSGGAALGVPPPPQFPLGAEGMGSPALSPPRLYPQVAEGPGDVASGPELATNLPEAAVTRVRRRAPLRSPRKEEKLVKRPLVKRIPSPRRAGGPPVLCKVPRVSLERLDLDLSGVSRPPVFRVFPGTSSEYFSLIVIEQGGHPQTPSPLPVKEEQHEVSIRDPQDTKPVLGGTLPKPPTVLGPPKPLSGLGAAPLPPGAPPPLAPNVSCCRVCDQAGAVVMCDRCQRCYHLDCHLPALQDVPSPEWICLLCQDLPPPPLQEGPSQSLSPLDQQKCEYVLLELLCYEPFRPLRHLSASSASHAALDLTLIRAKLQEKLGPPYRCIQEFAHDVWRMIQQFGRLTEDKEGVQSVLGLQRFFEGRLSAAFGDHKFSFALLLQPPRDEARGAPCAPPVPPLAS